MNLLPHWVLTDKFPAFYDSESKTALEQTARVYGAMQELITEYNSFVDSVNQHILDFENAAKKDYEIFTTAIRQEFQDFIDVVTLKIQSQDSIIEDAVSYMKTNLSESIDAALLEMRASGGFSQEVLKVYADLENQIAALNSRMNTFTALDDGSTTGDAELQDARTDYTGKTWDNVGEHIRGVTSELSSEIAELTEEVICRNVLNPNEYIYGAQLSASGIVLENGSNYLVTNFFEVDSTEDFSTWMYLGQSNTIINGQLDRICYYDADYAFISKESIATDNTDSLKTLTIPANAVYGRCHLSKDYNHVMILKGTEKPVEYIEFFENYTAIKDSAIPQNIMRKDDVSNHYLYGKKVAWYGDSIIKATAWTNKVNTHFNFDATNCGVGGTKISSSDENALNQQSRMLGQYEDVEDPNTGEITQGGLAIPSDTEVIIVGGGTNDWAQNVVLGDRALPYTADSTTIDVSTFRQACHAMFKNLKTLFPNAEIIVVGTPFGKLANRAMFTNKYGVVNNQGLQSTDYGEELLDVARMWGIKGFNYGRTLGINDCNVASVLEPSATDAHLHPYTEPAITMFADTVIRELTKLY